MRIEHVALWTADLEKIKVFFETYFGAKSGSRYVNKARKFESYFLDFEDGARLELMQIPGLKTRQQNTIQQLSGFAHIAISVGSKRRVDSLTARLKADGFEVVSDPRYTGDGYYESVVRDPDQNLVEITE